MSGIYGIAATDPQRPLMAELQAMQPVMKSWGEDRDGQWLGEGAALGHQLLVETPEGQHEEQPTLDPEGSGWRMVADARIDNREEMMAALGLRDGGRPLSDDQLIMKAWGHWGEQCFDHLVGAYAVVLWQESTRTLIAARDSMGLRPFVYHHGGGRFVFASDLNAVRAVSGVDEEVDETALLAYVHRHHNYFWDQTYLKGVKKLPPAHLLKWREGKLTIRQYWHPESIEINRELSRKEGAEQLRAVIDTAVRSQLRTTKLVGVHLSGGLDSSAVVALADTALRERGGRIAAGYTWSPRPERAPFPRHVEYANVRLMERQTGIVCQYCETTLDDVRAFFTLNPGREPTAMRVYEEEVCRKAREDGVGVLLSGYGGDEFTSFGGHGFFANRWWSGRWIDLARQIMRVRPGYSKGLAWAWQDILNTWPTGLRFRSRIVRPDPTEVKAAYTSSELRQIREWGRILPWRTDVHGTMRQLWAQGHMQQRIEDWASMSPAYGVCHRYPLLDRRVVEMVLSFPDTFFIHRGHARSIMRRTFTSILPRQICWGRNKREPNRLRHILRLTNQVCEEMLSPSETGGLDKTDPLYQMYRRLALNRRQIESKLTSS
jgi:asparagine synthase (glutamine-hydrolysing)